jgi:hypothetical protein
MDYIEWRTQSWPVFEGEENPVKFRVAGFQAEIGIVHLSNISY